MFLFLPLVKGQLPYGLTSTPSIVVKKINKFFGRCQFFANKKIAGFG